MTISDILLGASAVASTGCIVQEVYSFKRTASYPSTPRRAIIDLPVSEEVGAPIHPVRAGDGDNLGEGLLLRPEHNVNPWMMTCQLVRPQVKESCLHSLIRWRMFLSWQLFLFLKQLLVTLAGDITSALFADFGFLSFRTCCTASATRGGLIRARILIYRQLTKTWIVHYFILCTMKPDQRLFVGSGCHAILMVSILASIFMYFFFRITCFIRREYPGRSTSESPAVVILWSVEFALGCMCLCLGMRCGRGGINRLQRRRSLRIPLRKTTNNRCSQTSDSSVPSGVFPYTIAEEYWNFQCLGWWYEIEWSRKTWGEA